MHPKTKVQVRRLPDGPWSAAVGPEFREFLLIRRLLLSARNGLAMDDRIGQQGGEEVEPPFLHVELHALLGTFSREATQLRQINHLLHPGRRSLDRFGAASVLIAVPRKCNSRPRANQLNGTPIHIPHVTKDALRAANWSCRVGYVTRSLGSW